MVGMYRRVGVKTERAQLKQARVSTCILSASYQIRVVDSRNCYSFVHYSNIPSLRNTPLRRHARNRL